MSAAAEIVIGLGVFADHLERYPDLRVIAVDGHAEADFVAVEFTTGEELMYACASVPAELAENVFLALAIQFGAFAPANIH